MFEWSEEKDAKLRRKRGIGFEEIVFHIERGDLLAVARHPNREKYPDQTILYVRIEQYVYLVPCVQARESDVLFLKTIIPSRRATKQFLIDDSDEGKS